MQEFKRHHVRHVVRVCDPTYSATPLEDLGIKVHVRLPPPGDACALLIVEKDWAFPDGNSPPKEVLNNWTRLVRDTFAADTAKTSIGVHCVAGLGRAPVLVAVALIEAGLDPLAAVQFVRQRRPGSINASQLRFIKEYKPQKKENCLIM